MKKLLFLSILTISFATNAQNNVFPLPSGNVGIGTTTPTEKLEVVGTVIAKKLNVKFDPAYVGTAFQTTDGGNLKYLFEVHPASGYSGIQYWDRNNVLRSDHLIIDNQRQILTYKNASNQEFYSLGGGDPTYGNYLHMPQANSRIVIGSWGSYLFADGHKLVVKDGSAMIEGNILTNSNLGIGTASFVDGSDTYRLSVDGKIRANAVKVYTDWADFVFDDDYKLPTLEEVETYIKANRHLENIPSAVEVEKSGIELGEMNKLLLQKIEELTLYVIDLKREIELIKDQN